MKKKEQTATTGTPSFDDFWRAYPLHRDKLSAERAWKRLTAEQKRLALAALPAYAADCQRHGIAYKYAQGWLNGHRWEDNLTEDVAAKKTDNATPQPPATPPQPVRDGWGNRIGEGITADERQTFNELKHDLLQAWSRHRTDNDGKALRDLLAGLELYGISDERHRIYIHSRSLTFNREYTVAWFWDPADFDALVSRRYNGYKWSRY